MTVIITLTKTDRVDDIKEKLTTNGFEFNELSDLPNILILPDISLTDFPDNFDDDIKTIEEDAPDSFGIDAQIISLQVNWWGFWGLLRHSNRDNPLEPGFKLPSTEVFNCVRNGEGTDLYIIDTGTLTTHMEFTGRALTIDSYTSPIHYHGTACASLAAGANGGFARNANIFSATGLPSATGSGTTTDVLNAINTCLSHFNSRSGTNRPAVLSMSLSGSSNSYATALSSCVNAGLPVAAAAGNYMMALSNTNYYPAETKDVLMVGGINPADKPYMAGQWGTNYGTEVDVLGASQHCRTAHNQSNTAYSVGSGTSFGTPYVAGIMLCMLQGYNRPTNANQVRQIYRYVYKTATFGRYKKDSRFEPMTDAIAYLDPGSGPYEPIEGLTLQN